jgi:hypothetical protein
MFRDPTYRDLEASIKTMTVEILHRECATKFEDIGLDLSDFKVDVQHSEQLKAFFIYVRHSFAGVRDSTRVEKKTETKTEKKEQDINYLPATIWDHLKHKFLNFMQNIGYNKMQ